MPRRIEVELTSARDDGTWTWRAAGAREPKGVLHSGLLYDGAKVGDVVRADADFELDGITITAVLPPKEKKRSDDGRIEVIGSPRPFTPLTMPPTTRPRRERGRGARDGDRKDAGERPGRQRDERADRRQRAERPERPARKAGPARQRGSRPPRTERPPAPERPKPKRLSPGNTHRQAVLASLEPEQRPVAEQLLRGGMPAVRRAVEEQNAAARSEGTPEIPAAPLLAMAEDLSPRIKAAEWRDRADAALAVVDEVALRDLRSVVAAADAARDDDSRLLAGTLREALDRRITTARDEWLAEVGKCIDEGRVARALRLAARPPDPTMRFPADLATRLGEAAGDAMAADTPPDRWLVLLDAVAASPVRRNVKPKALPDDPGPEVVQKAQQSAGRIPALAALLGIDMPPPPGPVRKAPPVPPPPLSPPAAAPPPPPPPPPGPPGPE